MYEVDGIVDYDFYWSMYILLGQWLDHERNINEIRIV